MSDYAYDHDAAVVQYVSTDYYECSEHGDTVVATVDQWTGRNMRECSKCGAYVVVEGGAR